MNPPENKPSCCGQTPHRRDLAADLPDNPVVPEGTDVIYLGSGHRTIQGKASGLVYHVSDHRRRFSAHPDDVPTLLKNRDIMLKP